MTTAESARKLPLEAACPRLQPHISVHPLAYRGERWYLLRNASNMQTLRLNESAYAAVALLDGEHDIGEVLALCAARYGADAPSLDELAQLLMQLANAKCILDGMPAELLALAGRRAQAASRWLTPSFSLTSVRVPLWNPERFLDRLQALARGLYSPRSMLAWLGLLLFCVPLALAHFDAISAALSSAIWAPDHALLLGLLYLVIKFFHELSHALAIKAWGGQVREVGVMFMWFFPCPYVDGSEAAVFADKRKRALVAAAGVLAELTLAALGLLVFLSVEPGLIRTIALDVSLIGAVSTVLVNGNPLLKFDGYYVLEDLLEIPNLSTRAQRYYLYLMQRYLFGATAVHSPVSAAGERRWFLVYTPLAFAYRMVLLFSTALFFSEHYLAAGVAVASFALFSQVLAPVARGLRHLATSQQLQACRSRAITVSAGLAVTAVVVLGFIPAPATTYAEGVIGSAAQGALYSGSDGFVRELLVTPYAQVQKGQARLRLDNPELNATIAKLESRAAELSAEYLNAFRTKRMAATAFADELRVANNELHLARQRAQNLTLLSPTDGEFAPVEPNALLDRYVAQGQLLGYVISNGSRVVTSVVTQAEVGQIRRGVAHARVRLAERPFSEIVARELRETPGGGHSLASRSLGVLGGGRLAVDAKDAAGMTAAERVFTLELTLPPATETAGIGGRAFVRFDHPAQPIATQMVRALEQLFLRRLGV